MLKIKNIEKEEDTAVNSNYYRVVITFEDCSFKITLDMCESDIYSGYSSEVYKNKQTDDKLKFYKYIKKYIDFEHEYIKNKNILGIQLYSYSEVDGFENIINDLVLCNSSIHKLNNLEVGDYLEEKLNAENYVMDLVESDLGLGLNWINLDLENGGKRYSLLKPILDKYESEEYDFLIEGKISVVKRDK